MVSAAVTGAREQDVDFARRCFRAGHVVGAKPTKTKFRFKAGRRVVTVWATSARQAAKEAVVELDFRVATAGGRPPASGWKLTAITDDA